MAKTVFIVHNSAPLRQIAGMVLNEAGYDVLEAVDDKDALAKLDGRRIHLIISDSHMPNIDGIAIIRAAKQLAAYKYTPVIMLTAESGNGKKAVSQNIEVNAWMTKPFQPQQMLAAVSKLIVP